METSRFEILNYDKKSEMTEEHKNQLLELVENIWNIGGFYEEYTAVYYCIYELTKTYGDMYYLFCYLENRDFDVEDHEVFDELSTACGKDISSSNDIYTEDKYPELDDLDFLSNYANNRHRNTETTEIQRRRMG